MSSLLFDGNVPMLFQAAKPDKDFKFLDVVPRPGLILPSAYTEQLSRTEIIDKFLRGGWLPDQQKENAKKWFTKMLESFSLEILLHAKHGGLDRLLLDVKTGETRRRRESKIPLVIVPSKPKPPQIATVELEEISGELDCNVKTIKVKDVPRDVTPCSDCD